MFDHLKDKKIILASKSPRRKQLMEDIGIKVKTKSIEVEEVSPAHLSGVETAIYIAALKANNCPAPKENEIWICADTVVHVDNETLGKPENKSEAMAMLRKLSGKKHEVTTAVCLQTVLVKKSFYQTTKVHFKKLTTEEINYYVSNYKPFDKAGAYGIQEWIGMIGIQKIKGCYYNVMGLPLNLLYTHLMDLE